jgi:hypothetical protein
MAKILMMSIRRVIGTTPIFVMRISYAAACRNCGVAAATGRVNEMGAPLGRIARRGNQVKLASALRR